MGLLCPSERQMVQAGPSFLALVGTSLRGCCTVNAFRIPPTRPAHGLAVNAAAHQACNGSLCIVRPMRHNFTHDSCPLQGLLMVAAALPPDALPPPFDATSWRAAVREAGSALELRSSLGRLEEAIGSDYLSPAFHRRPLLVKGAWLPTGVRGRGG